MSDIKTKELIEKNIKKLDKSVIWTEKIKNTSINLKDNITKGNNEEVNEYSTDKYEHEVRKIKDDSIFVADKTIDSSKKIIKNNYQKNKINKLKNQKSNIKNIKKGIKKLEKSIKSAKKTAQETAKITQKTIEQGRKLAIATAKQTVRLSKAVVKVVVVGVKAIISALESLIGLLGIGGVVAILIVLVVCIVAFILSSIFGIFFANEGQSKSMTEVIASVNQSVYSQIQMNMNFSRADKYEIDSSYSNWREVIAVYSVKYSTTEDSYIAFYLNEDNISKLRGVFNTFNTVRCYEKIEQTESKITDYYGQEKTIKINQTVLHIVVDSKSLDDVMNIYRFTDEQKNQIRELLKDEYNDLWMNLLYGSANGNTVIVNVAYQETGYVHGDKFWKWYGFDNRVEWCAVFVSWAANEVGLLNTTIPKFSGVGDGIDWFKARGQWEDKNYIPRPGDIIFFDWENDGKANHVGIVEKVENGNIYTIEGNSTDDGVREKIYINNKVIFGYGVPIY